MANIYEERPEALHLLLDRGANNATVLIPDLQRPYVKGTKSRADL
jgi:hypothetical protein